MNSNQIQFTQIKIKKKYAKIWVPYFRSIPFWSWFGDTNKLMSHITYICRPHKVHCMDGSTHEKRNTRRKSNTSKHIKYMSKRYWTPFAFDIYLFSKSTSCFKLIRFQTETRFQHFTHTYSFAFMWRKWKKYNMYFVWLIFTWNANKIACPCLQTQN